MIIDQLFEDDGKKKKLNEIDPRNYDSDEDYYNDLHGEDDDEDFDPDADDEDFDDEEPESHYEKHVRVNNLEGRLNEFDMPAVGQATGVAAQNDDKPRQTYSVKIVGQFTGPQKNIQAVQVWQALEAILPRDYPRVPYQQQSGNEPQARVCQDINSDGFSIVKQGINSQDIAETIANKFESKGVPAEVIDGGLYEEGAMAPMPEFYAGQEITWRPKFAKMVPVPVTVVAAAPGKLKIKLQSPRMIQNYGKEVIVVNVADSDIMPKQGVAEARAATASFRASNKKRAELNAMSDEERRAYDKEQQEKQRKKDDARLEKDRQKNAAKKGVSESRQRKLNEAMLMEDPVYRNFKRIGSYIAERKMTEKEILDVFAQAETGMTSKDSGANRTMLGRGKDATTKFAGNVSNAVKGVLNSIQNSVPVSAVDVAYDQATDALANVAGGQQGPVMNAIKKYRNLAKQYPKTAGFAKAALVAIAGMATGGASLPVIAGLTYALDSAVKGDKLSSVLGKGAGAAALSAAGQAVHGAMSPDAATPQPGDADFQLPDADAAMNSQADLDAAREWINGDEATRAEIEQITGMSPAQLQDIAVGNDLVSNADSLAPGEEIVPPGSATGSEGLPGQFAGGQYEVAKGDQLGYIAQANGVSAEDIKALNPQINWAKPLQPGMTLNLPPTGDGAGSVWDGYTGGVYGDKVAAGAAGDASQAVPSNPSAASDYGMGGNAPIDYSQSGPISTDSLGQKLEYGIPVNDQGSFIPPNPELPADELATQTAAYNAWKEDFMKRWPNATQAADGSMQSIKPGLNTMQIMQKPTLPAETGLTPAQQTSLDYSQDIANPPQGYESGVAHDDDGNLMPGWNLKNINGKDWYTTNESIKFKKLPAEKLIDQKSTVLSWALSESIGRKSASVSLTTVGTYTVFENVDRYRKALLEYVETQPGRPQLPDMYRPDMPGAPVTPDEKPGIVGRGLNWLDKAAGKVGGALSNFGHQFTTGVTKEKLKMNWHQAGKPTDSDALAAWLVKQGVPQDVVTSVYGSMGIPYTGAAAPAAVAPATTGGAQKQMAFYGTNPATKKPWTHDELQAKARAGQAAPLAKTAPATQTTTAAATPAGGPAGFNAGNVMSLPGMEKYAKKPAAPAKPNFAQQGSGYAQVNQPTSVKYTTPGTAKPAPAPTGTKVVSGGPTPDEQAKLAQRIAQAAKQPVAEMLSMVETKEDVQRIKQFIDQTFVKYGAVSESAFVVRNKLIEHVTQVGAQRRREYARKS